MYNSILETIVEGSNTIFLALSADDYYLSYESLSLGSAQDLVENYFKFRGRDGVPKVADVDFESTTNKVRIAVEVDYERDYKLEPMKITEFTNDADRDIRSKV